VLLTYQSDDGRSVAFCQERLNLAGDPCRIFEMKQMSSVWVINALQVGDACLQQIGNESEFIKILAPRQQQCSCLEQMKPLHVRELRPLIVVDPLSSGEAHD